MATEKDLLQELEVAVREVRETRLLLDKARRVVLDAETNFINAKLSQERIQERYRIFKNQQVKLSDELSETDKDIERFKQLLPELLKKV